MKNSIELNCSSDVLENEIFFNQPGEKNMSHSLSCYPKSHDRVTFNKETLKFQPSFNLQSRQKSTPKPLANLSLIRKNQFQTPEYVKAIKSQNDKDPFRVLNLKQDGSLGSFNQNSNFFVFKKRNQIS